MQEKKTLARRLFWGYEELFWVFFLGSILGFVIEGLWHIVLTGEWVDHSATVVGPFCTVYGVGAVALFIVARFLPRRSLVLQFLVFAVTGGAVEYFTSLFQETTFGSVSWDYSSHTLNLGGRVSAQMAILWGFLGMLFEEAFATYAHTQVAHFLHSVLGFYNIQSYYIGIRHFSLEGESLVSASLK